MVAAGWPLVGCRHLVVALGCHSADVLVVALLGRCAAGAAWLVCGVGVRWKPDRREGDGLRGGGCGSLRGCKGGREASLGCISDGRHGGGRVWHCVFL
jgi:hypothetical protein